MLEPYSFTAEKRKWLEGIVEEKVQELIQQEVSGGRSYRSFTYVVVVVLTTFVQYDDLLRVTSLKDVAEALSKPYNVRFFFSIPQL